MTRYVLGLALVGILLPLQKGRGQTPGCAPSNPTGVEMVERFKAIVSATSSGAATLRTALDVPQLPQDSVVAVTDSLFCAALSAAQGTQYSEAPIAVTAVRLGSTRFAVFDKGKKQGEFETVSIYSSQYVFLKKMTF
jgi:hypothetical protein